MNKELTILNIDSFSTTSSENAEILTESLYKVILDSVLSNSTESLEKTLSNLEEHFEKISNLLRIDETNNKNCYLFGQIVSLTNLLIDINEKKNPAQMLESIANSYTLLLPVLQTINNHNTISGSELQKEMGMKTSSNLSNFLKRIEKFDLVNIHKVGTKNYISLTGKGERLLKMKESNGQDDDKSKFEFGQVLHLLDVLSKNLRDRDSLSSVKIVHECCTVTMNIREKRLFKQKIDEVLNARDVYLRNKVKAVVNIPEPNTYDRKVIRRSIGVNKLGMSDYRSQLKEEYLYV